MTPAQLTGSIHVNIMQILMSVLTEGTTAVKVLNVLILWEVLCAPVGKAMLVMDSTAQRPSMVIFSVLYVCMCIAKVVSSQGIHVCVFKHLPYQSEHSLSQLR